MAENYDAAKQPCNPLYRPCHLPDCQFCQAGPGGSTVNIENDEKGILETGLFKVISLHEEAALGSDHDSHRQGIYTTNSVGDND